MAAKKNIILFYLFSFAFVAADVWLMLVKGNFLFGLLPLVLLAVYAALFTLDKLILAVVFLTPLSIRIASVPGVSLGSVGIGASLPTSPILLGILFLFLLLLIQNGYDKKTLNHPITIIILFSLFWILITSVTSTMPIVSFKFLIDRCWGVATFYFLGIYLFRDRKNIRRFIWLYTASFTIVIFYTMFRQVQGHFTEKVSHFAMNPFYNDHTAYGAMLAMFMPVLLVFSFNKATRPAFKITAAILFFIFLAALGMSYSRASWVSVVVALFIFLLLKFRVKLTYIFAAICLAIALFFVFETQIIMKLQKNENQVSQKLGTEIESISNISTDASNLERLNRWSCAYRMFLDKPLIGFGPGTYSFQYAPYQLSYERTIISTNLGNGGNAHSEYLGPLAEQGIMGMLSFVGLAVMLFILSFRLNERLKDNELKLLSTGIFLGLVTYFVHGAMNNFLDTDKAAVPFWGFIGILVAIDLQSRVQVSPQTGDTSEARH
ncbi:MAG: hypothetical protein HKL88_09065 [Bacteroidia bacterium]|nr:hypothetical protein [Bacteroidia bacterium]